MKTAIFHQFLDNIGGAEIVTLILAREFNAEIYTTNINKEKIKKAGFEDVIPRINSIGRVPVKAPFKHQFSLFRFSRLKLKNKYDYYIISGDWAVSGAKHNKPNLWYVHSPCRELWDLKKFVRNSLLKEKWKRPVFDLWVIFNRKLHKNYMKHVNKMVCNSKNTQKRLKQFLKIDAKIINPPTETKEYYYKKPKNYWLSVNRLLKHKRIEMQLKAFEKMPNENLVVVGSYEKNANQFEEYKKEIDKLKPKNVEIKHWVSDNELKELYANSRGLICTAKDEDFGMTPVEAMASGKPIIASNEGGYKETIVDGKTGKLIDNINPEKISQEVKKISKELNKNPSKYKKACQKQAEKFDTKEFVKKIKKEMEKKDNGFKQNKETN